MKELKYVLFMQMAQGSLKVANKTKTSENDNNRKK